MGNKKELEEKKVIPIEDDDLGQMMKENKIRKKVIEKMMEKINGKEKKS